MVFVSADLATKVLAFLSLARFEVYQKAPAYALELLNSVLADGDQAEQLSRHS